MKRTTHGIFFLCIAGALLCAVSGCSTYRLGSMLPPGIETVYVPTFVNETSEPFIEIDTTRAAIEQLQRDGSLIVAASEEDADSVLQVTLTGYNLTPLAYEKDRRTSADEYRLTISARVVLLSPEDNSVIAENPMVQGWADFEIIGDFTTSKAQGLPAASRRLGEKIVDAVVEAW